MEKLVSEKLSASIVLAAVILAGAILFSASAFKPKVARYTFSPERQNWILVGDSHTGKSWSCVAKALYQSEDWSQSSDFPKDFEGCLEMSVPSKVQKRVTYELGTSYDSY